MYISCHFVSFQSVNPTGPMPKWVQNLISTVPYFSGCVGSDHTLACTFIKNSGFVVTTKQSQVLKLYQSEVNVENPLYFTVLR